VTALDDMQNRRPDVVPTKLQSTRNPLPACLFRGRTTVLVETGAFFTGTEEGIYKLTAEAIELQVLQVRDQLCTTHLVGYVSILEFDQGHFHTS